MRITIIGNASSGKSTLAKNISEKLKIPYLEIDRYWLEAGGHKAKDRSEEKERVRAYVVEKVEKFIEQDSWVSDGWYSKIQPHIADRADTVIFLDIPLWRRLLNHFTRMFGERHTELNTWDDIRFFYEIVRRHFTHGPKIRAFAKAHANKTVVLRSYKEAESFLSEFSK
jgi:adenylate kinase family enzyme